METEGDVKRECMCVRERENEKWTKKGQGGHRTQVGHNGEADASTAWLIVTDQSVVLGVSSV